MFMKNQTLEKKPVQDYLPMARWTDNAFLSKVRHHIHKLCTMFTPSIFCRSDTIKPYSISRGTPVKKSYKM